MNNTRNKFYLTNLDLKRTFYDVFTVHYMKDKENPHNTWLTNANLLLKSSALLMSGSHYAHQHTNTPTSGHTHNAQPTHTWTWPVALATCIHDDDDPKIGLKKIFPETHFSRCNVEGLCCTALRCHAFISLFSFLTDEFIREEFISISLRVSPCGAPFITEPEGLSMWFSAQKKHCVPQKGQRHGGGTS